MRRTTPTPHRRASSTLRRVALLAAAALLVMPVGISAGQSAAQEEGAERIVPLDLPRPPHEQIPEDAMPPDGERVEAVLPDGITALGNAADALRIVEDYVEDTLEPRFEREVFEPLRSGRSGDLQRSLAELADATGDVVRRLEAAQSAIDETARAIADLSRMAALEGSVLADHLAALTTEVAGRTETSATARVARAHDAAARVRDRSLRAAESPSALSEADLRADLAALRNVLDDIADAIFPEPTDGTWTIHIRPELIKEIFKIYGCGGKWVTILGTNGDDTIGYGYGPGESTNGSDVINGLAGNDDIRGEHYGNNNTTGAADTICGGPGDDKLNGWVGNDQIYGGPGNDVIQGSMDDDVVWGGEGDDNVSGTGGSDVVHGGPGNDQVWGDSDVNGEKDWVYGEEGDDIIHGRGGDDQLFGGDGADFMYGEEGRDFMFGGDSNGDLWASGWSTPGHEVIGGPPEFYYKCGGAPDMDYMYGGPGNDEMYGEGGKDFMLGGVGDDVLRGDYVVTGGGDDCLYGEEGEDTLWGGEGNDTLLGGDDNDEMHGGTGSDLLFGEGGDDFLYGEANADVLAGDYCVLQQSSTPGNDSLFGGGGNDLLYGQELDDTMDGNTGTDTCDGGPGNDTATTCEVVIDVPPPD